MLRLGGLRIGHELREEGLVYASIVQYGFYYLRHSLYIINGELGMTYTKRRLMDWRSGIFRCRSVWFDTGRPCTTKRTMRRPRYQNNHGAYKKNHRHRRESPKNTTKTVITYQ